MARIPRPSARLAPRARVLVPKLLLGESVAPQAKATPVSLFDARMEDVRATAGGPSLWFHARLHELTALGRAAKVPQEERASALHVHAVALVRPDPASRTALAHILARKAMELDPDPVANAADRAR
jgi:hypothetical protein